MNAVTEGRKVLLEIADLKVHFEIKDGKQWFWQPPKTLKAVDGVTLRLYEGETLGVVGESGCGKSTFARAIIGLVKATDGHVAWLGKELLGMKPDEWRAVRSDIQMIFQDPYASLNPRMTVGEIIREPMDIHNIYNSSKEREDRVVELLKIVGLKPDHIRRYPHEFSGGQRQRISIARTLALNPDFIICDEPISALDVSIQAQIINLLKNIQKELGISYLFVAHDLSMVKHISDRIGVMYLGNMVEIGESSDLYHNPMHPYTKALLSAVPIPDPEIGKSKKRIVLQGELPSPLDPPSGCAFRTRCPYATEECAKAKPQPSIINGRQVSCFQFQAGLKR